MESFEPISLPSLRFINWKLSILDQRFLPHNQIWKECNNSEIVFQLIQSLAVRGAPMIAIVSCFSLAQFAHLNRDEKKIRKVAAFLENSRPTAINLKNSIQRCLEKLEKGIDALILEAFNIFYEDRELCDRIGALGNELINLNDKILTHCNTGSLVTGGIGTALGVIKKAFESKKNIHVYVDETRPLLQGSRLTAWELNQCGISNQLICDNMSAALMKDGKINLIIVGADRIAINGDFANKIGTYNLAILANFHKIPFYVAAPYTTIDNNTLNGSTIPIEERNPDEVRGHFFQDGFKLFAEKNTNVYNPAFDVTPGTLVTKFIFDSGIYSSEEIGKLVG